MTLLSRTRPLRTFSKTIIRGVPLGIIKIQADETTKQSITRNILWNTSGYDDVANLRWCFRSSSPRRRVGFRCSFSSNTSSININSSSSFPETKRSDIEPVEASRQAYWDRMFDALTSYKSIHGDTLVPATYPENPQLGNWVDNQRQLYRRHIEGEELRKSNVKQKYPRERIDRLNSIGFVWNLYEHTWNIRFEELKEYIAEHGNSYVPQNYPPNEELGLWVAKQRRTYKVRQQGGNEYQLNDGVTRSEVIMSEERIKKLEDIGFSWDVFESTWLQRLKELRAYKLNHGDTLVPKTHPDLGRWVDKQRLDYKRYMDRKKMEEEWKDREILDEEVKDEMKRLQRLSTGMTEERIRLLEAEDFIFNVREYIWEQKFEELREFVALNGHGAIQESRPYTPLAGWASVQRRNYKKYQNGEKQTTLTEDRIERLNVIGFAWDLPKGGSRKAA